MHIAVVGCGPAGLAAAHAAYGLGAEVTIYSPGNKSPQRGPLILQRPIPAITTDHPYGYIRQIVIGGSILDYRYKLYGDININIQGNILRPGYHGWNHIQAYDKLWRLYMGNDPDLPDENWNGRANRVDRMITGEELNELQYHVDLVVNTAPLPYFCMHRNDWEHEFEYKEVEITYGYSYPDQPEDTTIFNAGDKYPWVRSAYLFGNSCTEWLKHTAPRELDPIIISKPISHNCNCFPRVLGTGRFGAWKNETWVDTAYYDTRDAIISMSRQDVWDAVQ
jgi:hypothetical protein